MRPYTRSLDPADYGYLEPHVAPLRAFKAQMEADGVWHRDQHEHRFWEYGSIMQQLRELDVPTTAVMVDVGSGGTMFAPYLASQCGYSRLTLVDVSDSTGSMVAVQRGYYGVDLPFHRVACEEMRDDSGWYADSFDVTMCISVIEHVLADRYEEALTQLARITKPGGLIFLTSDYFREDDKKAQHAASPWRNSQVTLYTEALVKALPDKLGADFVGGTDLAYRGDFVHNYSFVNICLRKRAA